jgi:hypothetical protein
LLRLSKAATILQIPLPTIFFRQTIKITLSENKIPVSKNKIPAPENKVRRGENRIPKN